jgi:hypothetical protein
LLGVSLFTDNEGLLKALCALCVFAFLAGDTAFALEPGGEVLTNFQVLEKISTDGAREIVAEIQAKAPTGFVLLTKVKGAGDSDFIFDDALVTQMRNAGYRVTLSKPNVAVPDSVVYELSYRIIRLSLVYPRIWRHHWFGSKAVERLARVTIRAELLERTTGTVLAVVDSQKQYTDTIPYALLGVVEEKQYEFTRPEREEFKMAKIVEPIIVAGIVTGLVYLFFSNQSNK